MDEMQCLLRVFHCVCMDGYDCVHHGIGCCFFFNCFLERNAISDGCKKLKNKSTDCNQSNEYKREFKNKHSFNTSTES